MQDFFEWYNVLFYVAILMGITCVFVSALGIGTGSADIESDIDADADADAEADGFFLKILSIFGIGRCPLSIVLFSGLLIFGGTGTILNLMFAPKMAIVSVIGAFLMMTFSTRMVASAVAGLMPNTETYAIEPEHFIGTVGTVVITTNETFGKIHVLDHYGSLHKLDARSYKGSFPVGKEVFVVETKDKLFYVEEKPQEIN